MNLQKLFQILNGILPNQVYYAANIYDDGKEVKPPFIVYQEMNKKPDVFGDDYPDLYILNVQITLVSKEKDVLLENTLEQALLGNDLVFTLLSEYRNEDKSLSRVYEIKMEEFTNGK